jgi:hypothetical protein
MAWFLDEDFLLWLDKANLGNDENPLDDDVLDLMYEAWCASMEWDSDES